MTPSTTPSMPSLALEELKTDALLLAEGASQISHGVASEEVDDNFFQALTRTLKRSAQAETTVLQAAIEALRDQQDTEAVNWLLGEAELEAECQYLTSPAGDDLMAVLFAIPVLFPEGTPSGDIAGALDVETLHGLMEQAEIVSATARFGLVPYFLTPEMLEHRPFAELAEATRFLGQQVADGEGPILDLGDCLPGGCVGEVGRPVMLRYLLGVAVVPDEDSLDLFWEEPENDAQAFTGWALNRGAGASFHPRGTLPDGPLWEDGFADALTQSTIGEQAILAVGNPVGFHEDRRYGRVLQREHEVTTVVQNWLMAEGSLEGARMTEHPVKNENHELIGWVAWVMPRSGDPLQLNWPLLPHEHWDDAHGLFQDVMEDLGVLPGNARSLMDQAPGRQWIH